MTSLQKYNPKREDKKMTSIKEIICAVRGHIWTKKGVELDHSDNYLLPRSLLTPIISEINTMVKYLTKTVYSRDADGKQTQTKKNRTVTVKRRNTLRETVCMGCRHNFYNWPREYSQRGVAVREDEGCWYLEGVNLRRKKNPCSMRNIG